MVKVYHLMVPMRDLTPDKSKQVYFNLTFKPTKDLIGRVWSDMYQGLGYQLVAEVDSNDLEQVFDLTNHIDHDWTTNDKVDEFNPMTGKRSTSVGDIFERDGKYYFVDNSGFGEL